MAYHQNDVNRLLAAARSRDVAKTEELWIDLQGSESPLGAIQPFLECAREMADRGDKDKAAELLLLLKDDLKKAGREDELLDILRKAVAYSPKVRSVQGELVELFRKRHGHKPGFDAVLARTGLASGGGEVSLQDAVKKLDQAFGFEAGDFVFHTRGWGIGKVVEAHPETGEFVIDFARNRGARMEAGMAVSALQRRSKEDLDVLLWTDKDSVRTLAESEPLRLLHAALSANGGKLQARDLREKLEDILDKGAWTKFWAKAKKVAKDDPRIEIGPAPRSIVSLREAPVARNDEVAAQLKRLRDFGDIVEVVRRELSGSKKDDAGTARPAWTHDVLEFLGKNHGRAGSPEQRAKQLELAILKDDMARQWPGSVNDWTPSKPATVDPDTGEVTDSGLHEAVKAAMEGLGGEAFPPVLQLMTMAEHRRKAVELVTLAYPAKQAVETLTAVLLDPAQGTWEDAAYALKKLGKDDKILEAAKTILRKPTDAPDAFVALARQRLFSRMEILNDRYSNTEVLAKAIQLLDALTLELRGTNDKKEKARLKQTLDAIRGLMNEKNQRAIGAVIEVGSEDEVRRILQLVRQSPAITPTLTLATERFIVDVFPGLLATVVAAPRPEETDYVGPIYTTLEGKRRREDELKQIMEVELEKVRIEIGKALEFGDISENSELDAARERQQRLAEQAERYRTELERCQVVDPATVETDEVRVGTRVVVEAVDGGRESTWTILGPWDLTDEDPSIVSHLSPLAVGLLGKATGDEATVRLPDGSKANYRVKTIDRAIAAHA